MLILLSPAKTLDVTPADRDLPATKPEFLADAQQLFEVAAKLSTKQIGKLMAVSDALADSTYEAFQSLKKKWNGKGAKQAALCFKGDVYQGLDADSLSDDALEVAQRHLRILSGLYGVLRPLDLMQAYRLEMGTKLKNPRGKDLYAFWNGLVTDAVASAAQDAASDEPPLVVNLASNEYFNVIDKKRFAKEQGIEVVSPQFKEFHNGKFTVMSFYAKRSRGMMARFLVESLAKGFRGTGEAELRKFKAGGYRYNRELSTDAKPVFTRDKPPAMKK